MRKHFSAVSTSEVTLTRLPHDGKPGESVTFTLAPSALGFREYLEQVYPRPIVFVNGKPEGIDPRKGASWVADIQFILLGRSLEGQVDTPFPAQLAEAELRTYVDRLKAEFTAANLTTGDINQLLSGMDKANAGMGKMGNGGAGAANSVARLPGEERPASP